MSKAEEQRADILGPGFPKRRYRHRCPWPVCRRRLECRLGVTRWGFTPHNVYCPDHGHGWAACDGPDGYYETSRQREKRWAREEVQGAV